MDESKREVVFNPWNVTWAEYYPGDDNHRSTLVLHFTGVERSALKFYGEEAGEVWEQLQTMKTDLRRAT